MNNNIKVFNISKPRCATQSMNIFLNSLGYNSMHWFANYLHIDYDNFINKKQIIDAIEPLEKTFNAFNDFPYTFLYDHFANKYTDAKFIMVDRNFDDWYDSVQKLLRHIDLNRKFLTNTEKLFYGTYINISNKQQPLLSKEELYEFYEAHRKDVHNYFNNTDRLLSISLEDYNISEKICKFLNIEDNAVFPNIDFLNGYK